MASDNGRETGERRRRERLAASLRENLKRRKAQRRARAGNAAVASTPVEDSAERESSGTEPGP
jgi:hypothetical protein